MKSPYPKLQETTFRQNGRVRLHFLVHIQLMMTSNIQNRTALKTSNHFSYDNRQNLYSVDRNPKLTGEAESLVSPGIITIIGVASSSEITWLSLASTPDTAKKKNPDSLTREASNHTS